MEKLSFPPAPQLHYVVPGLRVEVVRPLAAMSNRRTSTTTAAARAVPMSREPGSEELHFRFSTGPDAAIQAALKLRQTATSWVHLGRQETHSLDSSPESPMLFHQTLPKPNVSNAPPAFYRLHDVMRICALSRSTIYRRIAEGRFPAPVRLGGRASAWPSEALQTWINDPEGYRTTKLQS